MTYKLLSYSRSCNAATLDLSPPDLPAYLTEKVFLRLEKGWCPPMLLQHFYDQVRHAKGRRYSKDEAVASYAIDVHKGHPKPVRYYAHVWNVPRSTVGDWLPKVRRAVSALITRYRGVDSRREKQVLYANPDKRPDAVVNNEAPAPGSKRHWSTCLAHLAVKIRTALELTLFNYNCREVEDVDNSVLSPTPLSYREALDLFQRYCVGAGDFRSYFCPITRGGKETVFLPTDRYHKRRAYLDRLEQPEP